MTIFDRVRWAHDDASFTIGDTNFKVEQSLDETERATEATDLRFYKPRPMVEQYRRYFDGRPAWSPAVLMELGIHYGGSIAFWSELLEPSTHLAIDYQRRDDPAPLARFVQSRPHRSITTRWGVDQADESALLDVLADAGTEHLDLVIDDASHKYRQTVASFNALFPRLTSGGVYIIEDWSWCFDERFLDANPEWRANQPIAPIILQLTEMMARHPAYIARVDTFPDFIVIERGSERQAHRLEMLTAAGRARAGRLLRR